ncbi:MAG: hypothetical protein ABSF22_04410 [Bryobacteraceae bacterium]
MNMYKTLRFGFLAALVTFSAVASDSPAIGDWEGKLDTGSGSLRVVVHISQSPEGKWTASLDSPDQAAAGIPIDKLTYKEPDLHFAIEPLESSFDGKMNHEHTEITGEWKQSGLSLPLLLKRH